MPHDDYLNLTPHVIELELADGVGIVLPPLGHTRSGAGAGAGGGEGEEWQGGALEIETEAVRVGLTPDGVPVRAHLPVEESVTAALARLEGERERHPEAVIIVSRTCLDILAPRLVGALRHRLRDRVVCPDTGPDSIVLDEDGWLSGVRALRAPGVLP